MTDADHLRHSNFAELRDDKQTRAAVFKPSARTLVATAHGRKPNSSAIVVSGPGSYLHFFSVSSVASTNNGFPPITLMFLICPSAEISTMTLTVPLNREGLANAG